MDIPVYQRTTDRRNKPRMSVDSHMHINPFCQAWHTITGALCLYCITPWSVDYQCVFGVARLPENLFALQVLWLKFCQKIRRKKRRINRPFLANALSTCFLCWQVATVSSSVLIFLGVLPPESWCKGINAPSFRSLVMDQWSKKGLLSTHADRQGVDISFTVCLFVCTDMDFSAEDEASGVTFCSAVHQRPRQGITNVCELGSPRSAPKIGRIGQRAGHAHRDVNITVVEMRRRKLHARDVPFRRISICGYTSVSRLHWRRPTCIVSVIFHGRSQCCEFPLVLLYIWFGDRRAFNIARYKTAMYHSGVTMGFTNDICDMQGMDGARSWPVVKPRSWYNDTTRW